MKTKYTPIQPMTDEKMDAYVRGELKLARKKKYHKRQFMAGTPKGGVTPDGKKAYFRLWYLGTHAKDMVDVLEFIQDYRVRRFPKVSGAVGAASQGSYRSPRDARPAIARAPRPRLELKAEVQAIQDQPAGRKELKAAYVKGYRAGKRKGKAMRRALKIRLQAPDSMPKTGILGRVLSLGGIFRA